MQETKCNPDGRRRIGLCTLQEPGQQAESLLTRRNPMEQEDRLIRLPEVMWRTGKTRSGLYVAMKAGEFPPGIPIGKRARAWSLLEVMKWIEERKGFRDGQK